jgi:hypothetical protein
VIADLGFKPFRRGPSLDHHVGIGRRQRCAGELLSAAPDGAEEGNLGIVGNPGLLDVRRQIRFEVVVARQSDRVCALLVPDCLSLITSFMRYN